MNVPIRRVPEMSGKARFGRIQSVVKATWEIYIYDAEELEEVRIELLCCSDNKHKAFVTLRTQRLYSNGYKSEKCACFSLQYLWEVVCSWRRCSNWLTWSLIPSIVNNI